MRAARTLALLLALAACREEARCRVLAADATRPPRAAAPFARLDGVNRLLGRGIRRFDFRDPSRAPAAWRDLAVITPAGVSYGEVAALLKREAGTLLESVEPFDVYTGDQVGAGNRSVAVRLVFRGAKTLTDEEVDPIMERLMGAVKARGWSIREK